MTTHTQPLPMVHGKRPADLEVLARSALLGGLDIRELAQVMDYLDQVALAPGTCVFREGDDADYLYFVLEGDARIRRGPLELRNVRPGDHFGEVGMIRKEPRSSSVEALSTMRLARLSRARYETLAAAHPRVGLHLTQAIARSLGGQLMAVTDNIGLLAWQRSVPRRLEVTVTRGNERLVVGTGTLAGTVLPREDGAAIVVGAAIDRKPVSLEAAIVSDCTIAPLSLANDDGRAIYRSSAALLLLEAARRTVPDLTLRMGPSLENGQVVLAEARPVGDPDDVPGMPLDDAARAELAARLDAAFKRLVRDDLPLREEVWAIEEAQTHLTDNGWTDAAALLPSRRERTVTLVSCGSTFALGLGPVVPHAGALAEVSVAPHPAGLLLRLGAGVDRHLPVVHGVAIDPLPLETEAPRFGGRMTEAAHKWLGNMGVTSVGRYDAHCVAGKVDELVRVAEGFHEKWIGQIADDIAERRDRVKVIAIAGPSSSGKTTFIKRLTVQLVVNGFRPHAISLDDYYVDRELTVRDEHGELDFEAFEALDLALFKDQLSRLLRGETVATARYDFIAGKSKPDAGAPLALKDGDVLILEGIHGLNPGLVAGAVAPDAIYRVFVHPATTLPFDRMSVLASEDVRLLRRIVRDRHSRNYTAAETIARWPSVRRGELAHIFPYRVHADATFDSALVYELSVLKTYAERYLLEVPATHPSYTTAFRLRNLIDRFVAIYPDHVPPTSLLREFIGGSGFEY